jgi:hypothetical protein
MRKVQIEPIEYGGLVKKTATQLGIILNYDNLEDSLTATAFVYSETLEGLETIVITIEGKEYADLDTANGIDVNEEIARLVTKKTGFQRLSANAKTK